MKKIAVRAKISDLVRLR